MKTKRQEQFRTGFRSVHRLHSWVTAKALMLLVMLMLSVQGVWAQYQNVTLEGIEYRLENTTATVMSFDSSIEDLFIPAKVQYQGKDYVVSSFGVRYLFENKTFKSVTFEEGGTITSVPYFADCQNLESVILPSGLTSLAEYQFRNCRKLSSVNIPDNVEKIYDYAFQNCVNLQSVDIPNSVTLISNSVFDGCTSLKSVELSNSVTRLGGWAFQNCISLKSIELPNSLFDLGRSAFEGCTALERVKLSDKIRALEESVFKGCTSLQYADLPDAVTRIGDYAFEGCPLRSLYIPAGLTDIPTIQKNFAPMIPTLERIVVSPENTLLDSRDDCNAIISKNQNGELFLGCRNTVVPDNVLIMDKAFENCDMLTSITLSQNAHIQSRAFIGCSNLETIIFTSTDLRNVHFYLGNLQIDKEKVKALVPHKYLDLYKADQRFIDNFNVENIISNPATIQKYYISELGYNLGDSSPLLYHSETLSYLSYSQYHLNWDVSPSVFQGITGLIFVKHIAYSGSTTPAILDKYVIDGKTYTPVILDRNIASSYTRDANGLLFTYYQPYITRDGNDLQGAKVLSKLEFIRSNEPLTDPDYVRGLNAVFNVKDGSHTITYNDNQDWNEGADPGDVHIYTYVKATYETFQIPLGEIHYTTTDDTPLEFEAGAFGNNTVAEHTYKSGAGVISFNSAVQGSLNASVFSHNTKIKNIMLPAGITKIEDGAFEGCTSLENISFSPDMSYIGASAFKDCSALRMVNLPENLTTLGESAFENCSSLTRINVPKGLTSLSANVFKGCAKIETAKLPATITSIGASSFEGCTSLNTINAIDLVNVTSIGNRAFFGCSSLTKVEFVKHQDYDASSLTECEVGTEAFANCTGMTLITMPKMSHIPSKLFAGCTTLWTVYVPVYTGDMGNDIADDAFNKDIIAGIYLKEANGITTIPAGKFKGYRQLYGFEFPSSLESIGAEAFANTDFRTLSLGTLWNLTDIGEGAFSGCQQLADIVLPPSLATIKARTFKGSTNLKTLNLNNSVQTIGEDAFANCSNLQTILFGTALQSIGSRAFAGCKSNLDIVANLAYEGVYATNLDCFDAEVYANATLHKMGENKENNNIYGKAPWSSFTNQDNGGTYYYEYEGCTYQLYPDNYETPDGRRIRGAVLISGGRTNRYPEYINGDYPVVAFATGSISNVESIVIPKTVIRLEEGFVTSAPRFWSIEFGSGQGTLYVDKTLNYPTLHRIIIDRDVECLSGGLFEGFQSTDNELTLIIYWDASYLPKNCFKNSNLKKIEYRSKQVFGFEEGAFAGCKQINDIMVLTSDASMDETRCSYKTFEKDVIRNVNLRWEGTADEIERYKSYEPWVNFVDPEVTQVTVDGATYKIYPRLSYSYNIKGDCGVHNLTGAVLTGRQAGTGDFTGNVVIPDKVAGFPVIAVAENTFGGHGGVTSLSLPGTLRMIENDAVWAMGDDFKKFTIRDQKFPRGEKCYIGYKVFDIFDEEAFYGCNKLKEVSIGVDLTWEGTEDEPFEDRHGLRTIRITPGCHWFGKPYVSGSTNTYLFNSCDAVEEIIIEDGTEPIHFYGEAFEGVGHSNIKKLYVGRSLDTDNLNFGDGEMPFWRMGDDDGSQIIIGDQVEYIGQRAFGKTFFTDVHFGRGLKRIGKEAFCNSLELRNATGYCPNLEVIEEIAFDGAPFQLCMWCDPNHPEESKIKRIEDYATGNIKNIYLPLSLEYLGKSVATTNKKVYLYHSKDEVKNLQIHKEFYDCSDKPAEVYAACSYSQNELDDIFHAHDRVTINKNIFYHVGNHQKGTRKSLISGLYNSECDVCHTDLTQLNQLYNCYYYAPQWDGTNDLELYRTAKYSYTYNGVLTIQDNKPFRVPVDITTDGVIYNRTVTGGRVVTFALPFEADASEVNGKVYKFREFSDGKFCFDEQDGNLEAKVPYLVVVNEDATTLFNNVSATALKQTLYVDYDNVRKCRVTDSNSGAEHVGTFAQETFAEGDEGKSYYGYASTDGMFVKAQGATLNPFRTMFTLPQSAQVKRITLQLGDDEEDAIIGVDADLLDGEGSPMYDLNGVRIAKPARGQVYIQNGQKVIGK